MPNESSVPRRTRGLSRVTLLAVSLLGACATTAIPDGQSPIQANLVGNGDVELSPDHYRVSFSSSTARSRGDVERYLLQRAAEVTLQTGHTHFVFDNRDAGRDRSYYGHRDYMASPYNPDRFWYWTFPYSNWSIDRWPATAFSGHAEIIVMGPEEPARNAQAIEAVSLAQRLQEPPAVLLASAR